MRRREFIASVGSAAVWPLVARAQQGGKPPRLGILARCASLRRRRFYKRRASRGHE
jgi:hypothetical protein